MASEFVAESSVTETSGMAGFEASTLHEKLSKSENDPARAKSLLTAWVASDWFVVPEKASS